MLKRLFESFLLNQGRTVFVRITSRVKMPSEYIPQIRNLWDMLFDVCQSCTEEEEVFCFVSEKLMLDLTLGLAESKVSLQLGCRGQNHRKDTLLFSSLSQLVRRLNTLWFEILWSDRCLVFITFLCYCHLTKNSRQAVNKIYLLI